MAINRYMLIRNCEFAEDVLYDLENDVWVRFSGEHATVGVPSYMAWLAGRVTTVYFKGMGERVRRGAVIGSYEGPKYFGVVRSPIDGLVVEFNRNLSENPRMIQNDPYGEGWFAKLKAERPAEEVGHLVGLDKAKQHFEAKLSELRTRCYRAVPDHELYGIGVECSVLLVQLNEYLSKAPLGAVVLVATDEPTADVEMARWSKITRQQILEKRVEDGIHVYLVKKVV